MPALVLLVALVPIVIADLRRRLIPDAVVLPALGACWVVAVLVSGRPWWAPAASAVVVGGVLLVPALARPRGMGMGDVKLAALMGAALGTVGGLLALLAGLVAAATWGLVAAGARRVRPSAVALPLAPFLAVGAIAVIAPAAFAHPAPAANGKRVAAHEAPGRDPTIVRAFCVAAGARGTTPSCAARAGRPRARTTAAGPAPRAGCTG